MSDQRYYEIVAEELQRKFLRPGLWARAVAEIGGEGEAARALYIRLRVAEISQKEQSDRARAVAEEARAKKQQREAEMLARETEARRRTEQEEAEWLRIDAERAASPHFGLMILGGVIVALILVLVVIHILFR